MLNIRALYSRPNCGHRFHAECVLALQRSGVNNLCPLCRSAMPESAVTMVEDAKTLKVRAEYGKVDAATYRTLRALLAPGAAATALLALLATRRFRHYV